MQLTAAIAVDAAMIGGSRFSSLRIMAIRVSGRKPNARDFSLLQPVHVVVPRWSSWALRRWEAHFEQILDFCVRLVSIGDTKSKKPLSLRIAS